jgi:hypothetical protein
METEELVQFGPRLNLLTSSLHCDPLAKTPYHKYVPVRIQPLVQAVPVEDEQADGTDVQNTPFLRSF